MSSQITTAFVQQYSNNVQMLSQQKGSLLEELLIAKVSMAKMLSLTKLELQQRSKEYQDTATLHRSTRHTLEEEYLW